MSTSTEGRRHPDNGDGTFRNPIMAGDRPDPAVVRVGEDFYMTHSSFDSAPGLTIWHSRDLVNWSYLTDALPNPPARSLLRTSSITRAGSSSTSR